MTVSKGFSSLIRAVVPLFAVALVLMLAGSTTCLAQDNRLASYPNDPYTPDPTPTTARNMKARLDQIMEWIPILLRQGVDVRSRLSQREADNLKALVRAGNCREACPRIDTIYHEFEGLVEGAPGPQPAATPYDAPPSATLAPTTPENMEARFRKIMEWISLLLGEGENVDAILPRREAEKLRGQVQAGNCRAACPRIDTVYHQLERMVAREELPDEPPRSRPESEDFTKSRRPAKHPAGLGESSAPGFQFDFPTEAKEITVVDALPRGVTGVKIVGTPEFATRKLQAHGGTVTLPLTAEPIWIIEGELPKKRDFAAASDSPFGIYPATDQQHEDFRDAEELGVTWDRGGHDFLWMTGQPDQEGNNYSWDIFDSYFRSLPDNIRPLTNITVASAAPAPPRPAPRPAAHRANHFAAPSYLPEDKVAYSQWVEAVVERYDGDGRQDMRGLHNPVKYWQIDHEPARGRQEYDDLLRLTSRAIKNADPAAQVLVGGVIAPFADVAPTYKQETLPLLATLAQQDFDIVGLKWQGEIGEWRQLPEALDRLRQDLRRHHLDNPPIWITAMATYTGSPASHDARQELPFQSERQQAEELVKRYVVALGEGVEKIFWGHGLTEGFDDPHDNDFFDNSGLIYNGIGAKDPGPGVRKISYWTYQKMAFLLAHWRGVPPVRLELGADVTAYRFPLRPGARKGIVVAWRNDER